MTRNYFDDFRDTNIRGIVDFLTCKSDNGKSFSSNEIVSSIIAQLTTTMPKNTIAFYGKISGGNKNIDAIFTDGIFWNKFDANFGKFHLHYLLNIAGANPITMVTRLATVLTTLFNPRRMYHNVLPTTTASKMNLRVFSNIGTGAGTIKRLFPRRNTAALSGFFSAYSAVEYPRSAFPKMRFASALIERRTTFFRAKMRSIPLKIRSLIFLLAISANKVYRTTLISRMKITNFMFSITRLGTKFSYVGSTWANLKGLTTELTCNSNHTTIIPQGV